VYYHFASKDQILVECVRVFAADFVSLARHLGATGEPLNTFIIELFAAARDQRRAAKMFFIGSAGVSLVAENHRREVRSELGELFTEVARCERPEIGAAEAAVIGVGLVSLLEVSVVSMLATDDAFTAIGARRMSGVVVALARRLVGPA
jgi:AcrR family transcriptional regulator